MITGTITARHEMVIKLALRNSAGQEHEVDAVLDTGFTGSLTFPRSLIAAFDLRWRSRSNAV